MIMLQQRQTGSVGIETGSLIQAGGSEAFVKIEAGDCVSKNVPSLIVYNFNTDTVY